MTAKANPKMQTFIAFVLLFEYTLLPKFEVVGPMKFVHMLLVLMLVCYIANWRFVGLNGLRVKGDKQAQEIQILIALIVGASILGEALGAFVIKNVSSGMITDYMIIYATMFVAFSFGYNNGGFSKKLILVLFYLNIGANLFVTFLGESLPGAFTAIWHSFRETGFRNHGIIGNANSSMAVMNALLLFVVMLYRKKKLEIRGINAFLVFLLPILTVILINSRGEFLVTLFLEAYFIVTFISREKNLKKTLTRLLAVILVIIVASSVLSKSVENNPRLSASLERLSSLKNMFEDESEEETATEEERDADGIGRIFYRWDEFKTRFLMSPIFGSGFEKGSEFPFIKGMKLHNDIFIIGASSGLIGLFSIIIILIRAFRRGGFCMLVPFAVTALSNTYVYSNACMVIYMLLLGYLYWLDREEREEKELPQEEAVAQ